MSIKKEANKSGYFLVRQQLKHKFKYRLCQLVYRIFTKLCMLDENNLHRTIKTSRWFKRLTRNHRDQEDETSPRKPSDTWPLIILLIYILLSIYYFTYAYLKYHYDCYYTKVDYWSTNSSRVSSLTNETVAKIESYKHIVQETRVLLKRMGDPYIESIFFTQQGIIIVIGVTMVTYVWLQLLANYAFPFNFLLDQLILNERQDYERNECTIVQEVERLEQSSATFIVNTCRMFAEAKEHLELINCPLPVNHNSSSLPLERQYRRDHRALVRILHDLRQNNALHPLNRTSVEWIEGVIDEFLQVTWTNLTFSFVQDWTVIYFVHLYAPYKLEFCSYADRLAILWLFLYCQLSVISTDYHLASYVSECTNQRKYIAHLGGQIQSIMKENEKLYTILNASSWLPPSELINIMNSNLVRVYLNFRIFVDQFERSAGVRSWAISISLGVLFFAPLIGRIYSPYLINNSNRDDNLKSSVQLFSLAFSFTMIIFTDLVMVPLCRFQRAGESIYKSLCSLLAHCIDLQQQQQQHSQRSIYTEHMISVLRKELDEPNEIVHKFTAHWKGFVANYSTLISLHYYYGLLMLSLFYEFPQWRTLFGSRLDDPLAIYTLD